VLVNANVASSYINKAESEKDTATQLDDLRKGVKYYDKAISIHPTFVSGSMNRGVAYLKLNMPDSAKANYDKAREYYPNYPKLYEVYYNLGVCYYLSHKVPQAIAIWQQVMKMNPQYIIAQQSINTAVQAMNNPNAQMAVAPPSPASPATKPDVPPAQAPPKGK
jgi:tetratricopeptide (TPR) repeat protein